MTTRYMTVSEHTGTALAFLRQSEQEFADGDVLQGSEKLWGAASHATLAVAKQRGWPTGSHRNLVNSASLLAEAEGDSSLVSAFSVARVFHSNFYGDDHFNPFSETDALEIDRRIVADYVRRVVGIAGESPSGATEAGRLA